ncbi:response regulator transcription factor, partial [Streptomyces sp. NPDC056450]
MRVLVVEDEPLMGRALVAGLRREAMAVDLVT